MRGLIMIFLTVGLWVNISSWAQILPSSVIVSSGGYFECYPASLSWSLGESVIETYVGASARLTQGFQQPVEGSVMNGYLTYHNLHHSPLPGSRVLMSSLDGNTHHTGLSDAMGHYRIVGLQRQQYLPGLSVPLLWGGVNAIDAMLVMRHFAGLGQLTGLRLFAADVDHSGSVNSADALLIAQRFVDLVASFNVPDWLLLSDTVTISSDVHTLNLTSLCAGDVNGSYLPLTKSLKTLDVEPHGTMHIIAGQQLCIPVSTSRTISVGAVSLVMELPQGYPVLEWVRFGKTEGSLIFHQQGSTVRIAWYSVNPVAFTPGETLIYLVFKSLPATFIGEILPLIGMVDGSNIADSNGNIYDDLILHMPELDKGKDSSALVLLAIVPNPVSANTQFVCQLASDAEIEFTVMNSLGQVLTVSRKGICSKGTHTFDYDVARHMPGVYMVRMDAKAIGSRQLVVKQMIKTR